MSVRDAGPDDAARLAELLAEGTLGDGEDTTDIGAYRAALEDLATMSANTVLVAEIDGRVVGMCQLVIFRHVQQRGGWCAEVESVHVDAALRSRGIGGVLMGEVVRRARAAGCYRVQLTSNLARPDAQRWYRRLGFIPSHTGFKLALGPPRVGAGDGR